MKKLPLLILTLSGVISAQSFACCPGDCCPASVTKNALSLLSKYEKGKQEQNSLVLTALLNQALEHKNSDHE